MDSPRLFLLQIPKMERSLSLSPQIEYSSDRHVLQYSKDGSWGWHCYLSMAIRPILRRGFWLRCRWSRSVLPRSRTMGSSGSRLRRTPSTHTCPSRRSCSRLQPASADTESKPKSFFQRCSARFVVVVGWRRIAAWFVWLLYGGTWPKWSPGLLAS